MNALKPILLSLLTAAGLPLAGVSAEPSATNINPALLYYQAFLVAPAPLPQAEWDYLASKEGRTQRLPDRYAEIVAGYDSQFALVRQAALATVPCDWGADLSLGPDTPLPYLARAKATVIAARLRVAWDLQHDRQADACDDLLASLCLARNVSRDGILISVLVQIAMEAIACTTVAENFGQFSPETLKRLADGLESLPARGTVAGCVPTKKVLNEDWTLRRIQELQRANSGDDDKVMAAIHDMFAHVFDLRSRAGITSDEEADGANWWARLTQAAGGTSEGVARLVTELGPSDQKLASVMASPYGQYGNQVKQLESELEQSSNPLLSLGFSAWENSRAREFKALVFLAMVRAATEYRLHGAAGLQQVSDPCGQGPFALRRFVLEGVDRGFELKSANVTGHFQQVLIFVEKEGPPFFVDGPFAGQARQ
jgi:hypothetical protein